MRIGLNISMVTTASPFLPTQVSGCVLWLHADFGVTVSDAVDSWADHSGSADANKTCTQAGATRPTFVSSVAGLNNKSALLFTGSQKLVSGVWASALAQPFTVFLVGKGNAAGSGDDYMFDGKDAVNQTAIEYNQASAILNKVDGSTISVSVAAGTALVACGEFNGNSGKLFVNSRTAGATNGGTNGLTGTTIGNYAGGGAFSWDGHIRHVLIYSKILSTSERNAVLDYLGGDAGITIAA